MRIKLNLELEAHGSQEAETLSGFIAEMGPALTRLEHAGAAIQPIKDAEPTAEPAQEAPAEEAPAEEAPAEEAPAEEAPAEEAVKKVTKKTYFYDKASDSVFILNKDDDYPTDPEVSAISKASYDEHLANAEQAEEEPEAKADEALEGEVVTEDLPTMAEVKKALSDVVNKKGATVAKALLEEAGAARLSDMDPADYPGLMVKIAEVLA